MINSCGGFVVATISCCTRPGSVRHPNGVGVGLGTMAVKTVGVAGCAVSVGGTGLGNALQADESPTRNKIKVMGGMA